MKPEGISEKTQLTSNEKNLLYIVSILSAGVGAILGMIAYYQQWLG